MVRRTVWSLGRAEDLDDIVQDVFVRLWRYWGRFDGRSERRTWVYRVTVNTARSHWRSRGRLKAALQRLWTDVPRAQVSAPAQEAWDLDRGLAQALAKLDRRQREALTLVHLEGLSLAEAAQVMGVPEGTVKSRLFRARALMQVLLAEDGHGKA
jgi:RNA polymerase sigma-70 factor (ECF subfamily)